MNIKMHEDEVKIDRDLVNRLLSKQFPQWSHLPIKQVISAGTDNALYRFGEDMVIRLPRIEKAARHIEKESVWLPQISSFLPVAIPKPLVKGAPDEEYPYLWAVYSWLEGENPTVESVKQNPGVLAKDLAEFINALHNVTLPNGPSARRGAPLRTQDESTRAAIEALQGMIDTDIVNAIWNESLQVPEWSQPAVWVHGDLMPMNLLVTKGRLSAVLDFGGLGIGDPACDLIPAWNFLPANVRNDFRSILQVDDATWARGRGWALSIALVQLPYYKDSNPVMANNARHVIKEVIADYKSES